MKILLVDDHEVVRRGLRQMLIEAYPEATFGEASNAAEALQRIGEQEWDLLVLDIHLPGRSGLEVLPEIRLRQPRLRILVLSMASEEEYAVRALKSGAAGYLSKETVAVELVNATQKIMAGGIFVSAWVAEKLALGLLNPMKNEAHEKLSNRELHVLRLIATGSTIKDIASALTLSEKTIFTYRERLREKLNLHGDVDLARYALRHKLVD